MTVPTEKQNDALAPARKHGFWRLSLPSAVITITLVSAALWFLLLWAVLLPALD